MDTPKKKILLVEDDLSLSNSIFDFLDDFADVMQVFDGEEGLYEAESGVYDLILLDLMLPEKGGFQVLKELREQGIIVRYFNKPRINQFLRITVGTDEQNQRLVDTLKNDILK
jgi:CheY-like chemotaxis protein